MSDLHLQHLAETNKVFADQIKTADQKAAYIFTFLLALLVWSSETRRAFSWTEVLDAPPAVAVVSLLLAVSVLASLVSAILVVLPRSRPGRSLFFWGAWPGAGDRLVAARGAKDVDFLFAEYLQNTNTLATICRAKYRMVGLAFRALLVSVLAYAALLVLPT